MLPCSVNETSVICCIHLTASSDHADFNRYTVGHSPSLVLHYSWIPQFQLLNSDILFYHQFYSILQYSQQKLYNHRQF